MTDLLTHVKEVKISDIDYSQNVIICEETDHLDEVLKILKIKGIGSIVVVNEEEKVAGIFTERDYLIKVPRENVNLSKEKVSNYMTRDPFTLYLDSHLSTAMLKMHEARYRHIVLVNDENRPLGMLSQGDIFKFFLETFYIIKSPT